MNRLINTTDIYMKLLPLLLTSDIIIISVHRFTLCIWPFETHCVHVCDLGRPSSTYLVINDH